MLLTPIALLFSRLTHFMKHNTYTNIFNYTHDIVQAHHIERLFTQTYIHFSFSRFFLHNKNINISGSILVSSTQFERTTLYT